jgi:integrase
MENFRKNYNIRKQCQFCQKLFWTSYLKIHLDRCKIKKHIEINNSSNVFPSISQNINNNLPNDNRTSIENLKMKKLIEKVYFLSKEFYEEFLQEDITTAEDKIRNLLIAESTKALYFTEWKLFTKWLNKHNKEISSNSVNDYLRTRKCRPSTLKRKHTMMKRLLDLIVGKAVKFNRFTTSISFRKKYSMSEKEVVEFLKEQKKISLEDYLIAKLMIVFSLRVNSIAQLRRNHLLFMDDPNKKKIIFLDSKVKSNVMKEYNIDQDLIKELKDYIKEKAIRNADDFVFFVEGNMLTLKKRKNYIMNKLNKRIKESTAFVKNENFMYSSHMLRKTIPNLKFREGLEELKREARRSLNHNINSTSVSHYIDDES